MSYGTYKINPSFVISQQSYNEFLLRYKLFQACSSRSALPPIQEARAGESQVQDQLEQLVRSYLKEGA